MFYDRKIKYLDYCENGSKVSGGGFAKLEVRDNTLRLELIIRGLHPTDSFDREIVLQGAEKEEILGQVHIQNGSGQYRCSCDADRGIGGTGISYSELCGIRIFIGGTREILCQWGNISSQKRTAKPEKVPREELEETPKAESKETSKAESENVPEEEPMAEPKAEPKKTSGEDKSDPEELVDTFSGQTDEWKPEKKEPEPSEMQVQESAEQPKGNPAALKDDTGEQQAGQKMQVMLLEDKWQQLSALYPHIQPFHDERDYLSLTPSDFVLFPTRFYRAVNNSFLLHGYYNYHHLILARIERRGEVFYYIGVPGNYFEREKQVAIMFGFESFECEAEPAKTGDFGYYMMRTEL